MFIVKRFRKPCLAMSEDGKAWEYLAKRGKWVTDPNVARAFGNVAACKLALQRAAYKAKIHRYAEDGTGYRAWTKQGDEVFICRVVVTTTTPVAWTV